MSPTLRYRLRLFAYFAPSFGLFMLLFNLLVGFDGEQSFAAAAIGALVSGLLFGVVMTWIIGSYHLRGIAKLGAAADERTLSTTQTRRLELPLPRDAAFARALDAVGSLPRASVQSSDAQTGRIEARVGMEWRSWGEELTVTLVSLGPDRTEVTITSSPRVRMTMADYGKNLENVLLVERLLVDGPSATVHA